LFKQQKRFIQTTVYLKSRKRHEWVELWHGVMELDIECVRSVM